GGADGPIAEGRTDAETTQPRDGHPRHGAAGGPLCDPVAARECLHAQGEGEERSPSSQGARAMAPWWSRSPAQGSCREDGAHEGADARSPEGKDGSPPSQASAWSWLEDQGGVDDDGTRSLDAVGDPHLEGASPPAQAALRDE